MNNGGNPMQRRVIAGGLRWLWWLMAGLALLAFWLGYVGFRAQLPREDGQAWYTLLTCYRAATLFAPETDFARLVPKAAWGSEQAEFTRLFDESVPLQVARILAPFTTTLVILRLLFGLAQSALMRLYLRYACSVLVSPIELLQSLLMPALRSTARFLLSHSGRQSQEHAPTWLRQLAAENPEPFGDGQPLAHYKRESPWLRRHVVICGLGKTGMQLVEEFRKCGWRQKRRVVVIEATPTEEQVERCRALRVCIVVGDATHRETLLDAGVQRAERIVITVGKQVDRLECAAQAADLCRGRTRQLLIHLRVDRTADAAQLRESPVLPDSRGLSLPVPFSTHQYMARRLLSEYPLWNWAAWRGQPGVHVVLFGFTVMAEELALAVGRLCHSCWSLPPRLTWVVREPEAALNEFSRRYPHFEQACEVAFRQGPPRTGIEEVVLATDDREPVTAIFVCGSDQSTSLQQAHEVRVACKQQRRWLAPVFAFLPGADGLTPYTHGAAREPRFSNVLELFGKLEHGHLRADVIEGEQEIVPQLKHQAYLSGNASAAGSREWIDPEAAPWRTAPHAHTAPEDLGATLKESNRWAAEFIPNMLAAAGCEVGTNWRTIASQAAVPRDHTASSWMLEEFARLEHRRWMAERYVNGWSYDPIREDARKKHNLLVDWAQVPDAERPKDRDAVLSLTRPISSGRTGEVAHILKQGDPPRALRFAEYRPLPAGCTQPVLSVGVIGHCELTEAQQAALDETLRDDVLPTLASTFPAHYFRLLSAIAPGADTVFARAATDYLARLPHWHGLHVVEPFPVGELLAMRKASGNEDDPDWRWLDPLDGPDRTEMEKRAEWIIELLPPGVVARELAIDPALRKLQYERGCAYVVERSHVLILVVDPARPVSDPTITAKGKSWRGDLESIPQNRSSWPEVMRTGQYQMLREQLRVYHASCEDGMLGVLDTVMIELGNECRVSYETRLT